MQANMIDNHTALHIFLFYKEIRCTEFLYLYPNDIIAGFTRYSSYATSYKMLSI